jgi:acyl-CoA thioester hydrolase
VAEPLRKTTEIEVRYAETDQMGIVHHSVYVVWFEVARAALSRETGHSYAEIEGLGYYLVVTGARIRYLRGARYGECVAVTAWLDRVGSRGLTFAYEVRRGAETLATGTTEHVWVDKSTRQPCRLPRELCDRFRRIGGLAD